MREPFATAIDDDFFFRASGRNQHLNMLLHLIQYSEPVLLVTGSHGIGKSTLLQQFIHMANDDWHVCLVNGNNSMDTQSLLQHVAQTYDTDDAEGNADQQLARIREQLIRLHHAGKTPILLVDDAHELNEETLQYVLRLSDLYGDSTRLFRVILFSEPLVKDILSSSVIQAMQQHATHTLNIPPLDEADTVSYILHRLGVAGLTGYAQLFNTSVGHRIHKNSHGIPLLINKAARAVLLEQPGYGETDKRKNRSGLLDIVTASNKFRIVTPLLLAVAVTAGYFTVTDRDPGTDSQQTSQKTSDRKTYVLARPHTIAPRSDSQTRAQTPADDISISNEAAPLVGIHGQQTVVQPLQAKSYRPVPDKIVGAKTATSTRPAPEPVTWSEQWWRKQDPTHYTIMLLGSHSKPAVVSFIRQHQLANKAGYFQSRRQELPWYVVIFGIYPDKQSALRAAEKLPAYAGTGKPWVRSMASVHADMNKIRPPAAPAAR